jgi:hypothetical protein
LFAKRHIKITDKCTSMWTTNWIAELFRYWINIIPLFKNLFIIFHFFGKFTSSHLILFCISKYLTFFCFATVLLFRLLSSVYALAFISPHFNTAIFRSQTFKSYQLVTSISLKEINYSVYVRGNTYNQVNELIQLTKNTVCHISWKTS